MVMVLLLPTTHVSGTLPLWHAAMMADQSLSAKVSFKKLTVTAQVLLAGAVWFVPAATLMVIVALPLALPVTVTVVPDTLTVAAEVLLLEAEIVPSPALVTVMVLLFVVVSSVMLVGEMLRLPAALEIAHMTFLAVVVPSLQR